MEFSSILFLCFFFPIFFIIFYLLPERHKNKWLLLGSLYFLIDGRNLFFLYFLLITGITYFILVRLNHLPKKISKKKIVTWVILVELLIWYLFIKDVENLIFPICYTVILLSNIGSLLDFYRNKRKTPALFYYLLYASCFSKLLFGPIISYYEMEAELKKRTVNRESLTKGCFLFLKGLFINVLLVGTLSELIIELKPIDSIFSAWLLLGTTLLQIGLFMMSYSNMSIGLSTMLGFTFKRETNYPLCLYKMRYFLSSWHSSLTTWWDNNLLLLKKKLPFFIQIILFMVLMAISYGFQYQVILWFILIGLGIFLEETIHKKTSKIMSYLIHFMWLLLCTIVLVSPNILDTINHLFNIMSFPFINSKALYYFESYFLILVISLLISSKITKKIANQFQNKFWYHVIRNIGYMILLWMSLVALVSGVNHFIWMIQI